MDVRDGRRTVYMPSYTFAAGLNRAAAAAWADLGYKVKPVECDGCRPQLRDASLSRQCHAARIEIRSGRGRGAPPLPEPICYNLPHELRRRRNVLLVQLPIPPLGPAPIRGNVPLAGAYLKVFAEQKGLGGDYAIDVLPAELANTLGDHALAAALADREPWMVGFTCYLWNIERTLWIARRLKRLRPGVRVVLGGPEITADNAWVLDTPDYDFAVVGEGEQTFANLLLALLGDETPPVPIAGLYVPAPAAPRFRPDRAPAFRTPMPDLNRLRSPYLAGILDAADERMMLLETTRGCVFKCKFCYYPKSYDKQYYLSRENVLAGLRHAAERGAREVFLLDPTLNQRQRLRRLPPHAGRGQPRPTFQLLRRAARGGNHGRDGPAAARGEFHGGGGRPAIHRAGDDDEDGPQEQPAGLRARRAGDARVRASG